MHIGQQLLVEDNGEVSVYSEWMQRQGDNATFTVELIGAFASLLTVTVFHKNSEDTGPGTSAGSVASSVSSAGFTSATIGSLKEMVRYKVTITSDASGAVGGLLYRMLAPTWFNTALV